LLKGHNKAVIEERAGVERIDAEVGVRIIGKWTVTERLAAEQESIPSSTEKEIQVLLKKVLKSDVRKNLQESTLNQRVSRKKAR